MHGTDASKINCEFGKCLDFFLPRFFPHCKQDLWEKLCTNDLKESPPLDSMAQN